VSDIVGNGSWLIGWGWFSWILDVELGYEIGGVFEVFCRIPSFVRVVETCPLYIVLKLVSVAAGIEDLFDFPLLVLVHDYRWRWRLLVSGDRFSVRCWLEEADVENWVEFDGGGQVQLIGSRAYSLQNGVRSYLFVI
jgi:hypothetical protein